MIPTPSTLMRPPMPDEADQARSVLTASIHSVLDDDWDDLLFEWLELTIGKERAALWGPVDTSVNDIGDLSRQLSTPGLYGVAPTYRHANRITDILLGMGGQWQKAGMVPKLQHVQYMAIGLGDYLVRPHLDSNLDLSCRLVSPHNVFILAHPDYPDRPVRLQELRLRFWEQKEQWVYTWDVYDIRTGHEEYSVVLAGNTNTGDVAGADLSHVFLASDENQTGDYKGENYPWFDDSDPKKGRQNVIPWGVYHSVDAARTWNYTAKRGAYRGTLNSALFSTYANQAARDASGTAVMAWGLEPISSSVKHSGSQEQFRTALLKPGAILYHTTSGDTQPGIKEVGPGAKLDSLAEYGRSYSARIMTRFGLSPSDVSRQSANPASASSLIVSDRGRRDYSNQVQPLFRRSDEQLLGVIAVMYRMRGVPMPTTGYTVEYVPIPDSPQEQKEEREQLTWEEAQGLLSKIDLYQNTHPGTSREDAERAIVLAMTDNARIETQAATVAVESGTTTGTGTGGDGSTASATALNGAQIESATGIVNQIAMREIPRETGIAMLQEFFNLTEAQAEAIVGDVGTSFFIETPED